MLIPRIAIHSYGTQGTYPSSLLFHARRLLCTSVPLPEELLGDRKLEFVTDMGGCRDDDTYNIGAQHITDMEEKPEMNAALYLCEDLINIRRPIMKSFVAAKRKASESIRSGSKQPKRKSETGTPGNKTWPQNVEYVFELIHHAAQELQGNYGFRNTERKLGKVSPEARTAMRSHEWTEDGLEAVHLEQACKRAVNSDLNQSAQIILRRHGRLVKRLTTRLARAVFEEFEAASIAAVGGVHRSYREEAANIMRTVNPKETISVFSTFLAKCLMSVSVASFLSDRLMVPEMLSDAGVLRSPEDEDGAVTLTRMMSLLDDVEEEVSAMQSAEINPYINRTSSPELFLDSLKRFRRRAKMIPAASTAPVYIQQLVAQFDQWEALVRNDVPELKDANKIIFDVIFSAVAILRTMRTVFPTHFEEIHKSGIARKYMLILKEAITQQYKENAASYLSTFSTYVSVGSGDYSVAHRSFFDYVDAVHLEATMISEVVDPNNTRVAIALREVSNLATRSPRCCGLFYLLTSLTQELYFHLRFRQISRRMTPIERQQALKNTKLWHALEHFEKVYNIEPPSVRSVAFLTTLFVYLLSHARSSSGGAPILLRFVSPTNHDELSVISLNSMNAEAPIDIHVSHPPQLRHHSWAEAGTQGIYRMMPSRPVIGTMSDIFMKTRPPMLRALDVISKVPWRVSKYIVHVQERILVDGYGFHKIQAGFHPLLFASMNNGNIPCPELNQKDIFLYDKHMRKRSMDARENDFKTLREVNAVRSHYLLALRTARSLMSKPEIFFPHKLDFRGRMYPVVGRFNHTGSDPFRAMIEFAEPIPLGKEGVFWLKVHLANLMGMNKLTFEERAQYVDNHIADVVQSAEDPLGGDRWWQEAEEPVQALRTCYELSNALKHSQGAENYMSHLPVHIDGSCNGLQHYSAIGRDEYGGQLVNLVPSARPQDVYSGVLNEVIKAVKRDAEADNEVALRCLGSGKGVDKNHLRRKTIKRAVMTQVYGVTYFGMADMIRSEFANQNQSHQLWSPLAVVEMANYIRDKLIESIGITFSKAQKCRTWIDNVTTLIWKCQPHGLRQPFQWVTPLGLIVRQPYLTGKGALVYTPAGAVKIDSGSVSFASRSQLTALPPNLIHSLDAVHLALTALEMDRQGIPMVAVHDSFWCHPSNMPKLSLTLRKEFANLYRSYDPLWELKEQWEEQFFTDLRRHNVRLPDPPARGTLNIDEVLNSPYFFG